MNTIRGERFIAAIAIVALAGLADCKSEASPPTPGTVTVSFHTPNTDYGAALFTVTGPGVRDAQSASSTYKVYWRVVSATEVRFLVVGNLTSGVVATVTIDDLAKVRSEEHTSELESQFHLVCRLLLEKKNSQ